MPIIHHHMIEATEPGSLENYNNYKKIDFTDLLYGFTYNSSEESRFFINRAGLCFEDYVGCKFLTGNELLYYPELAQKLRGISDYPILKRIYTVDKDIKGIAFIEYFYKRVMDVFTDYQAELATVTQNVNNLIYLYGHLRYTPLIDGLELEETPASYKPKLLVINGLRWGLCHNTSLRKETEYIDLYRLLNISHDMRGGIAIEEVIPGTPFIALRLSKSWRHKGQVYWYNLDTRQKVSKSDIRAWKKPV